MLGVVPVVELLVVFGVDIDVHKEDAVALFCHAPFPPLQEVLIVFSLSGVEPCRPPSLLSPLQTVSTGSSRTGHRARIEHGLDPFGRSLLRWVMPGPLEHLVLV